MWSPQVIGPRRQLPTTNWLNILIDQLTPNDLPLNPVVSSSVILHQIISFRSRWQLIRDPTMFHVQRIIDCWLLTLNWGIHITFIFPRAQGSFWKKGWKIIKARGIWWQQWGSIFWTQQASCTYNVKVAVIACTRPTGDETRKKSLSGGGKWSWNPTSR